MPETDVNRIDVWTICAKDFVSGMQAWEILDGTERARAWRFLGPSEREMFVRGHATMRSILARYVSLPPAALRWCYGDYGKPYMLDAPDLHFNWSHAGDFWLLAVSRMGPVGIDIESAKSSYEWRDAARVTFHPQEVRYVEDNPSQEKQRFLDIWTRKEAVFKGIGTGLHNDMAEISLVDEGGTLKICVEMLNGRCWEIQSIPVPGGYVAALAMSCRHGGGFKIGFFDNLSSSAPMCDDLFS